MATSLQMASSSFTPLPAYAQVPAGLRGRGAEVDAVYVHVPFCSTKCHYCDFYSLAGHDDQMGAFLGALERELAMQGDLFGKVSPRTIFIGGGTPTLLPAAMMERLLETLRRRLDFSRLEEFTTEANPNTFDAEKARVCAALGVNRISFGAQSFHKAELGVLQRDHDPASVGKAFAAARGAGIQNLSLDLIFGIPGQTVASWEESLTRGLELRPNHMSCYSLTYEANTAMTARLAKGEFSPLDEETELAMFTRVYERMRAAGFVRYETSNYARVAADGNVAVCRHNLHYWKAGNWLAFGPSAGAHFAVHGGDGPVAAWQWKNVNSLTHYLAALAPAHGEARLPWTQMEGLERSAWAGAAAAFWLRLGEGLSFAAFEERIGVDPRAVLRRALARYEGLGVVEMDGERARILDAGVAVSNRILGDVLAGFEGR